MKRILIGLAALVGLVVLAGGLLTSFFPKTWALAEAERRIEAATGRDLTIGGDVNLTFWPALGFSAREASLSNPEGFAADTPFLAADRIVFAVAVMPLLRGNVEIKRLIFDGVDLQLVAKPDGAANWTFPTGENESASSIGDLRLDEVRLTDSSISFDGGDGQPPMVLSSVEGSLRLDSLDQPAQLDSQFEYRGQRLSVTSIIANPRAVLEQGETPLTAEITSNPLAATFDGAFNAATGGLDGRLTANGASLRQLSAWMGSPMAEGGGFGAYRIGAQMARLGQKTRLTDAVLSLDDIQARGALTLTTQENGRMLVTGALTAPNVDLNPYLPAPAAGAEAGVATSTAWTNDTLDLTGLRAIDANLDLNFGALRFPRLSFADVQMALHIAGGAADARLSRISLYSGGGTARLIADGSGPTPRIAVELNAQNIQAEPLLRDAVGFDKIAGRGRLTVSLIGQGASQAAIMRSLRGTAAFNFNDGQLKGMNLAQVARTIQSALGGAQASGGAATDFAEMSATFQIAGGVAATDNVRLLNPFVRLEGQGVIDIGGQSIDMRIAPRAVNSMQGQGGNAAVAGLGIPFRLSGPWSSVSFAPALGDVVQNELRARIGGIMGRQDQTNPLTQLGASLFGQPPAAQAAQSGANPPAPNAPAPAAQPVQQPQNPLANILGNVLQGRDKQKQPPPPPTP